MLKKSDIKTLITDCLSNYYNILKSKVLTKDNTTEYTPTDNYNPATKQYVDNKVATIFPGGTTGQILSKKSDTDNDVEWSTLPQLITHITPPDNYETSDIISLYNMLPVNSIVIFDNDYWITDNIKISNICYVTSWIFKDVKVKTISILETGQYVMLKPDGTIHNSGYNADDLAVFFAIINNENRKEGQVLKVGNGGYYYEWGDIPQLAFNEDGELVVTIDGVSKTFIAKEEVEASISNITPTISEETKTLKFGSKDE